MKGQPQERSYNWTAAVLWPVERRVKMIGPDKMTEKLQGMTAEEGKHDECVALARAITTQLLSQSHTRLRRSSTNSFGPKELSLSSNSAASLLQCLQTLGENVLIQQFLACDVSRFITSGTFQEQLISLLSSLSVMDVKSILMGIVKNSITHHHHNDCCFLFRKLFEYAPSSPSPPEFLALCKSLTLLFCKRLAANRHQNYLSVRSINAMLEALLGIKEATLLSEFLVTAASATCIPNLIGDVSFSDMIIAITKALGWKVLAQGLRALFNGCRHNDDIPIFCHFLVRLVPGLSLSLTVDEEQQLVCETLSIIVISVIREGKERFDHWNKRRNDTVPFLPLMKLAVVYKLDSTLRSLIAAFLIHPDHYPLHLLVESVVSAGLWAGEGRGTALCEAAVAEILAFIDTELKKPEPRGRSKKAIEERESRQKLRHIKVTLSNTGSGELPNQHPLAKKAKLSVD